MHAEARKSRSLAEKRAEEARRLMVAGKRERKPSAKVRHLHSAPTQFTAWRMVKS